MLPSVRGGLLIVRSLRIIGLLVVAALGVSCSSSPSKPSSTSGSPAESLDRSTDQPNTVEPSQDSSPTAQSSTPETVTPTVASGASLPTRPTAPTATVPVDPAAGLAMLHGDLELLTEHLGDPAVIDAARTVLDEGVPDPALRFAATFVWANVGDDPSLLVPLLTDPDPAISLTAAIGIVGQGGAEGFAPLIAALTSDAVLTYYGTGETAWTAATVALVQFTGIAEHGPPFDADASQRLLAQQRWQAWLDTNAASLSFNANTELWSTS